MNRYKKLMLLSSFPRIPLGSDRSLIDNSGIYLDFEDNEIWTQNQETAIIDTAHVTRGSNALKLTSANNVRASADHVPAGILPINTTYVMDVYIDDVTRLSKFQLSITNTLNWSKWLEFSISSPKPWVNGWNKLVFTTENFSGAGGATVANDWKNWAIIRIAITSTVGNVVNVWIDNFRWYQFRPALTFTFDDGRVGNYQYAAPIFRKKGFAATCYVVTDAIGKSSYEFAGGGTMTGRPLSIEELNQMQSWGWDIANHTMTHPDLRTLDLGGQTSEIQGAYNWLTTNGFTKARQFFATPYGYSDTNTLSALISSGMVNSRLDSSADPNMYETPYMTTPSPNGYNILVDDTFGLHAQSLLNNDGTSLVTFQGWVERAIQFGMWCIILGHDVGPNGYLSVPLLISYLNYLGSVRSQIDVLTMSEYWSRRASILSLL